MGEGVQGGEVATVRLSKPGDLRELRDAEVLRLTTEHAREPFDLAAGPLLRMALLRLEETEHRFLFNVHHIVEIVAALAMPSAARRPFSDTKVLASRQLEWLRILVRFCPGRLESCVWWFHNALCGTTLFMETF